MTENKKKNNTFLLLVALTAFFVITVTVTSSVLIIKNDKSEITRQNKTKTEVNPDELLASISTVSTTFNSSQLVSTTNATSAEQGT